MSLGSHALLLFCGTEPRAGEHQSCRFSFVPRSFRHFSLIPVVCSTASQSSTFYHLRLDILVVHKLCLNSQFYCELFF